MAITVHMRNETFKRYRVVEEDEHMFDHGIPMFFGAQAIRSRGIIDESLRSLSGRDVTKVTRS